MTGLTKVQDKLAEHKPFGIGEVETLQEALDKRLPEIENYTALRAYTGPVTAYYVRGVANIFDGGAGIFRVDAADTTTADNGGTVIVDASGRRWKREFGGDINVRWFGVRGVGVGDDLPGFTAAVEFLSAQGGGVLRVPEGTFVSDGFFEFTANNITVIGNGDKSIFKTRDITTNSHYTFKLAGDNNTIKSIKIDGNKSAISQPPVFFRDGCYIYGNNAVIEDVTTIDTVSSGIRIDYGNDPLAGGNAAVRNCRINNAGTVTAANNAFGIIVAYMNGVDISGNRINGSVASGIFTYGCVHQVIQGNTVTGTENGIRTQPKNTTPTGGDVYAAITGNVCYDCAGDGIRFTGNYTAVSGNTVTGCSSEGSGLFAQGGKYQTISGNTCIGNAGYGIAISTVLGNPSDYVTIVGNTCTGNYNGITMTPDASFPITNLFIADNNLLGNTSYGIDLRAGGTTCTACLSKNQATHNVTYATWTLDNGEKLGPTITAASDIKIGGFNVYPISGTADINTISGGVVGQEITLYFLSDATGIGVVDSANIRLNGNFLYKFASTLKLVKTSAGWIEVSRCVT